MALVKQEFKTHQDGSVSVINHVDVSDVLDYAKEQRELDPYLDKGKNWRRICTIPVSVLADPTNLEIRFWMENVGKNPQEASKWLKKWLNNHEYFKTTRKL